MAITYPFMVYGVFTKFCILLLPSQIRNFLLYLTSIHTKIMSTVKVLLIDDDIRVSALLKRFLYEKMYDVISAENGPQGIEMAKTEKPDIIFCDIMMPEMDGYGVLKALRMDERTKDIPFFFLTAKSKTEDFMEGISAGATGYHAKPTSREELIEAIQGQVSL